MPQQPARTLTGDERTTLESFVHRGKAKTFTSARMSLAPRSMDMITRQCASWHGKPSNWDL